MCPTALAPCTPSGAFGALLLRHILYTLYLGGSASPPRAVGTPHGCCDYNRRSRLANWALSLSKSLRSGHPRVWGLGAVPTKPSSQSARWTTAQPKAAVPPATPSDVPSAADHLSRQPDSCPPDPAPPQLTLLAALPFPSLLIRQPAVGRLGRELKCGRRARWPSLSASWPV